MQLAEHGVLIKIELNMIGRGLLGDSSNTRLCETALEEFYAFCVVPLVSLAQLYSGKICAALDRQHPRDLWSIYCANGSWMGLDMHLLLIEKYRFSESELKRKQQGTFGPLFFT